MNHDTVSVPRILPDPSLEGAGSLFDLAGREAVARFVEDRGWRVRLVKPVQALYRPTQSCLVRFNVRATDTKDQLRVVSVSAETRAEPKHSLPVDESWDKHHDFPRPLEEAGDLTLWFFPYDPGLRTLPSAARGNDMKDSLSLMGRRPLAVASQPIGYRPRRRAMFRYAAFYGSGAAKTRASFYAKVLRSERAGALMTLSRRLEECRGPLSWARRKPKLGLALPRKLVGRNVVIVDSLPGTTLQDLLLRGAPLPRPERIADLMDDLVALTPRTFDIESRRHRRSVVETSRTAAELLHRLVPECSSLVDLTVDGICSALQNDVVPRRVVHGDLYAAQVLVQEDFSLALVDLDDFGMGDPALDAANFSAHLLALALTKPGAKGNLLAFRTMARAVFMKRLDVSPHDLDWREAFVMLQLATGPFRTLRPDWPKRVGQFLEVAHRLVPGSRAA